MGAQRIRATLALVAALSFVPAGHAAAQNTPPVPAIPATPAVPATPGVPAVPGAPSAAAPGATGIQQVELTVDNARRTLEVWKSMKEMSDSLKGKDLSQLGALYTQRSALDTVRSHGFPDVETWHRTLYTFMLSAGAIGKEEQYASIPAYLRNSMAHLLPKAENIAIAKEALENPDLARMYKEISGQAKSD